MKRLQHIYKKLVNSLFGDVEVFFGLPLRWRIRGAFAIGFLYLAIVVLVFLTLYPTQDLESYSVNKIIVGYMFLFIGVLGVIFPIFIPPLRNYPGWVILVTLACFIISFNIILAPALHSDNKATNYAFFIGLLAITFGARLYARVIREVVFEKTRIDTEIKLAQKIQTDLLPLIDIEDERFQAFGKTVNAQEIGGDFFDVIKLKDEKVAFCIGDVSGHNIAAGLIMGIVKSAFRTELRYSDNLESIAGSLNTTVIEQRSKGMFVSCAIGIIDFNHRNVKFINAGHPPVVRLRNGRSNEITIEGAAFGLSRRLLYKAQTHTISSCDTFVCYSDGIIEARNRKGEEFGHQRLMQILRLRYNGQSARKLHRTVYSEVEKFIENGNRIDDITLLILKIR